MDAKELQVYLDFVWANTRDDEVRTFECTHCSEGDFIFNQDETTLKDAAATLISHVQTHHRLALSEIEPPPSEEEIQELFGLQSEHSVPHHPREKFAPEPEEGS